MDVSRRSPFSIMVILLLGSVLIWSTVLTTMMAITASAWVSSIRTTTMERVRFVPSFSSSSSSLYSLADLEDFEFRLRREARVWFLQELFVDEETKSGSEQQRRRRAAVVYKPPSVVCHHSEWTGSRRNEDEPTPMLQRVRDADGLKGSSLSSSSSSSSVFGGAEPNRVHLVHRLDRGASGCLLVAYDPVTAADLSFCLGTSSSQKTYVALVRGSGVVGGEDYAERGWFMVDRPIRDEGGVLRNATTAFRFVAGTSGEGEGGNGARASLVLAKPSTGRWHQVRRHLNGLSHPILGDTSHGCTKTNKEWRTQRGMPYQRTFLHLARLTVPSADVDAVCPIPPDFMDLLRNHLPSVLERSLPILEKEGIVLPTDEMMHADEVCFGGTSAKDYSELPQLQKRERARKDPRQRINTTVSDVIFLQSQPQPSVLPSVLASQTNDDDAGFWAVVDKPPGVACHTSSRTKTETETPMLQRVRDHLNHRGGSGPVTVDLIHRLDRGASGCLLVSVSDRRRHADERKARIRRLIDALRSEQSTKTYVALVHGSCPPHDLDCERDRQWFKVTTKASTSRKGRRHVDTTTNTTATTTATTGTATAESPRTMTTWFRFVASDPEHTDTSLVLARPFTGRFHQIRIHLARVLRRPIVGDSTHGGKRHRGHTNADDHTTTTHWRPCLHLSRLQLPEVGVDASSPLPEDMRTLLRRAHLSVWDDDDDDLRSVLREEGVVL